MGLFRTPRPALAFALLLPWIATVNPARLQDKFPEPPPDATRIYYLTGKDTLEALPFEPAITSLNVFVPAKRDAITRVRFARRTAATVLPDRTPRFFVFVADKMEPPPHQLVRLSASGRERTLQISLIQGRKGYAPFEADNVRLRQRILERLQMQVSAKRFLFVNYMELRPVEALTPGEYAIIGDSLADIATFRIE